MFFKPSAIAGFSDDFKAMPMAEAALVIAGVDNQRPAGRVFCRAKYHVGQRHAARCRDSGASRAADNVCLAAIVSPPGGNGKTAHQFGDVVHIIGIGSNEIGHRAWRAEWFEQHRQGRIDA